MTIETQTIEGLKALLRDVADNGLIYWGPNTARGAVARADMFARINASLALPAPAQAWVEVCIHCGKTRFGHGGAWCSTFVPAPAQAEAVALRRAGRCEFPNCGGGCLECQAAPPPPPAGEG
jgi:hypothetical protein